MLSPRFFCLAAIACSLQLVAAQARAGVSECNGIRVESFAQCELQLDASCEGSCMADIFKKACATRRFQVCQETCEIPPTVVCTDDCSRFCDAECARGVDVVCKHNCFPECVGGCEERCAGDATVDAEQCVASCQATCDGECTVQCAELPASTSCVKHCAECCQGSCRAIAGMDCQLECQDQEFESCEHELQLDCMGSCSADGALFCDGEFIAAGDQLLRCAAALVNLEVEVTGDGSAQFAVTDTGIELDLGGEGGLRLGGGGCSVAGAVREPGLRGALPWLLPLAVMWLRRGRGATRIRRQG